MPEKTGALFQLKKNPKDLNEQISVKLIQKKDVSRDSLIYTFELPQDMNLGLDVCKHIAIEYLNKFIECVNPNRRVPRRRRNR